MIIKDIHITGFGRISNKSFTFGPGINLICGHNEAGKSTLHSFIFHMLYGLNRARGRNSRFDDYAKYCPWDYPDSFGGSVRIVVNNVPYLIERSFNASNKSLTITNEITGKVIHNDEKYLNKLIGGISENAFSSTLCISQLGANSSDDLADLLKKKFLNLGATSSFNIDAPRAVKTLTDKKKELAAGIDDEALTSYYKNVESIETVTRELNSLRLPPSEPAPAIPKQGEDLFRENEQLKNATSSITSEYEQLKSELKNEGFESISDITALETLHNNLWSVSLAPDNTQSVSASAFKDRLKPLTLKRNTITKSDILHGSIFSFFVVISIILFALSMPFLGVIALLAALIAGFFTVASFFSEFDNITRFMNNGEHYDIPDVYASEGNSLHNKTAGANSLSNNNPSNKAMDKDTAKKLSLLYKKHLRQAEVSSKNRKLFINYLNYIKENFNKLEDLKKSIEDNNNRISTNQNLLLALNNNNLDSAKQCWTTDNLLLKLDSLEEEKTKLELSIQENNKIKKEIEAIELAISTIKEVSAGMHAEYAPEVNKEVSAIFNTITRRNCGELLISEKMDIILTDSNRAIPIEALSQGTIEQIYFSLRLAAANMILEECSLPLMLDEVFAMYDNPRLAQTLKYISSEHKGQTFIFSCQNRERLIAEKLEIPFTSIKL